MIHLIKGNACYLQAVAYCQCGKARTVLFSIETLLLNCSDELPIFYNSGSGITTSTSTGSPSPESVRGT